MQERSVTRIDALLDAAAEVVDQVGFDRLTTAMVAERAGASIGTVYRYFPDRIALLQSLRERATYRYRLLAVERIELLKPASWDAVVDLTIDAYADMYRCEKGFRITRFLDTERGGTRTPFDESQLDFFAKLAANILVEDYALPQGDELVLRLACCAEIVSSLVGRAFAAPGTAADERFIVEARRMVRAYLGSYYS
ncbi:TetR/AcrR family transcriptional regulator [Gryllotalpicola sp.]|uniref:TetR/AcrR family transcriptional regulator n=1 Tax=Gryllotalpicola sp. TaxID=1932787 RepID=UPI00260483CC|nr:TetR/AcrR family transcriptional regulator [Gryllotalpicola sp.]